MATVGGIVLKLFYSNAANHSKDKKCYVLFFSSLFHSHLPLLSQGHLRTDLHIKTVHNSLSQILIFIVFVKNTVIASFLYVGMETDFFFLATVLWNKCSSWKGSVKKLASIKKKRN